MRNVYVHNKLKSKVPRIIIKRIGMTIVRKAGQRLYKSYQGVFNHEGSKVFLVFEFQGEDDIFITQARYV